jgi:hypothetical protein
MSQDRKSRRQPPLRAAPGRDTGRYRTLQTGYREALLVQLDLTITELEEEGDFTPEQIERAVALRLEGGPGALRRHKLAEEWTSG